MIQIKCLFPDNNYLLRKVKIKVDNKTISRVGHNEIVEIDNQIDKPIKFKLDYHKANIQLSDFKTDKYLIVYLSFRNYVPYSTTDLMFKNCMRVKEISKEEFEKFDMSFFKTPAVKPLIFNLANIYVISAGILLALQFTALPFLNLNNDKGTSNFSFLFGLISLIGFVVMIFNRKKLSENQYNIRNIAFGIASVILLFFINIYAQYLSLALALSIVFIALYNFLKK